MTQEAIASRLGISQAAVSKYLSANQAADPHLADHPQLQTTVTTIADGFVSDTLGEYEALAELLDLIHSFEDRGPICDLHEEEMPALQGLGCDLCIRGRSHTQQTERDVLAAVRTAVRQFTTIPTVSTYVPNVGTNIAMALPTATDETAVAAVPGRLHAIRSQIHVPSDPEFGASQHVARTIVTAHAEIPKIRGGLNLRTSEELLSAAREASIPLARFNASYDDRETRLQTLFEEIDSVPCIVYHEGAFGIEPITYVLARTAVDAVETTAELIPE